MTVEELITELQTLDPKLVVCHAETPRTVEGPLEIQWVEVQTSDFVVLSG